ncbi:MAG: hypothetical protein INQ03_17350 [Candidatus Heimdallarchaeota archaeon]|nr:hypothetical protein [Candidatus Heimdallarchaeota archaeon]
MFTLIGVIYAFEILNNKGMRSITLGIIIGFSIIMMYILITEITVEPYKLENGDPSFKTIGNLRIFLTIASIYSTIIFFYYTFKIWVHSPQQIKYHALLNLTGTALFGPIAAIFFGIGLTVYHPVVNLIIAPLGLLISSIAIYRCDEILYVLPFQVRSLRVIAGDSGLSLFSYYWMKSQQDIPE